MIRSILVVVAVCMTSGFLSAQSKGDAYFQEGKNWLDKGNNEKAIKAFQSARAEHLKTQNYYRYYIATDAIAIMYQTLNNGQAAEQIVNETMANIPGTTFEQLELHAKLKDNLGYTYLTVTGEPEKAIDAYSQAITFYERAGKGGTKSAALELINRSIAYQELSQFQLSVNDVLKAIAIHEKEGDTPPDELSSNYYTLGFAYTQLQEFDKALTALQKGNELIQSLPKSENLALFYAAIGDCYSAQNKNQLALRNYESGKAVMEELYGKDADHYCAMLTLIGDAHKKMGDWERALLTYQEVLTIYQKIPPSKLENIIPLMMSVSNTMRGLGRTDQAITVDEQAMLFATTAFGKNSQQEAEMYYHLGVVAYNRGEYDKSLAYNFKAQSILDATGYVKDGYYGGILEAIGMAYQELRTIDQSLIYKQQAKELYQQLFGVNHAYVAAALGNIGLTYEVDGNYDQALDYLNQSIVLLSKDKELNKTELGIAFIDLGRVYLLKNNPKEAVVYLEKARTTFDGETKNRNKAKVYNELGAAYFLLHELNQSMACFQKAVTANVVDFEEVNPDVIPSQPVYLDYYQLVTSCISKADVYRVKGDKISLLKGLAQLEAADQLLKQTVVDFNNPVDRLALSRLNTFYTEVGLQLVDQLYRLTKEETYIEKAFYFSERSKANQLFSDIQVSKAVALARVPKALLARRSDLVIQLNTLHQQIASATSEQNQPLVVKLRAQELDLTREYESVLAKMNEASPRLGLVNRKMVLPTWKEVSKTLDAKTVFVSYSMVDSAKYILIGSQSKLVLKKIDAKVNLDRLIRGYMNQIKTQQDLYHQTAEKLTGILWTPVEEALLTLGLPSPDKIIIVPEGPLHYLPFETLGKDHFLIEKYALYYSFSGALLVDAGKQGQPAKPSFIAMAPVFEDKETNFVNTSCERFVEYAKKTDNTSRAFSLNGEYITPLPGTRTEVEAINQVHLSIGSVTRSFIEETANEEHIKKGELEHFDYIHLATHGFVNSQYPELSGLLLAQDANSPEDGILYSGEILGLKLNAQLVTLSACETALGKKVEGEGTRGLATAFLFAGARNVVASLWKVSDASTAELMIDFYTEMLTGKDKATALKLAKLKLIHSDHFSHPYYWSPFIQLGGN